MADKLNYGRVKSDTGVGRVPTGTILPWSKTVVPSGYLKCDGTAVSRATYADLFDIVGTTYGVGDGSTTFNLPNLTSRTLVGANTSTNVGQTSGAHDTTGAGFTVQNNLAAQNSQNLAIQTTENLSASVAQNLTVQSTENLAVGSTNNLAGAVTENLGVSVTENLSGVVSGNLASHTLVLGELPSHTHPAPAASNMSPKSPDPPTPMRYATFPSMTTYSPAGADGAHNHTTNFSGSLTGNVAGNFSGGVSVNLNGNLVPALSGTNNSAISGSVGSTLTGGVSHAVTGNVSTNITGDVQATNVSIYEPHIVIIYIIKT